MLRTIKLLIDLHTPEGTIPAGTDHQVDEKTYEWLLECYAFHRAAEAEKLKELELMYPNKDAE